MKVHYTPYPYSDESEEHAACGTLLGENSQESSDWLRVDCRHCISRRVRIEQAVADEEAFIVQQMGHMAEHMREDF